MVLCVSNVMWTEGGVTEDGLPVEPHPELEVTDGWYRLRAQVDQPLARAIRRGVIRVGRKIAVAGARVSDAGFSGTYRVVLMVSYSFRRSAKIPWKYWNHTTR